MKIALVGYGRMWHMIEEIARKRGYDISIIISPQCWTQLEDLLRCDHDVVIDFSIAGMAMEHMQFYAEHDMRVVMGTTGWYEHIDTVKQLFEGSEWALIWWGNFSIGVHLFWKILENASKTMNHFDSYDVFGHESHHNQKSDSPSGTAIATADIILKHIDRKDTLITEALTERRIAPNELHFSSTRGGNIPGTHSVYFDSPFDTIEISHTARTREGFAVWAILAADWLRDKKWYYEISDFTESMMVSV